MGDDRIAELWFEVLVTRKWTTWCELNQDASGQSPAEINRQQAAKQIQ